MDLRIELVGILLLTSLTGSIALLLWKVLGFAFKRIGYLHWYYSLLKGVVLLFLVPAAPVLLIYTAQKYQMWRGILFSATPLLVQVSRCFLALWLLGCALVCVKYMLEMRRQKHLCRACICVELDKRELLDEICQKMGMNPKRFGLLQNYGITTPVLKGIFRPRIILPADNFSKETLSVIFIHELTHAAHKDILWKRLAIFAAITQFYNPLVWLVFRELQRWGEYACDASACELSGGAKKYFGCILEIAERKGMSPACFGTHLIEDKAELLRRVKFMQKMRKTKKKPLVWVLALSAVLVFGASLSVFAATTETARQYEKWFDATVVMNEVEPLPPLPHYTDDGPAPGIIVEEDEFEQVTPRTANIEWTVGANTQKSTGTFYVSAGSSISVMVSVTPSNKTVKAGVIWPDGTRDYVSGSGVLYSTFTAPSSGYYKVFVENGNSTSVTVEGSYIV